LQLEQLDAFGLQPNQSISFVSELMMMYIKADFSVYSSFIANF